MLRTSVVPTMLQAGIKSNVIPPTAEATLDIRMLPDEDVQKFPDLLAAAINDPQVKVVPANEANNMPSAPASRLGTVMFAALEHAQKKFCPIPSRFPP